MDDPGTGVADGWERTLRERDAAPGLTRSCFLLATDQDGVIIGLAAGAASGADPSGGLGEVGSRYLHHDHQRRGLGRRLLGQLAECLARKGIRSLHIGVLHRGWSCRGQPRRALVDCAATTRWFGRRSPVASDDPASRVAPVLVGRVRDGYLEINVAPHIGQEGEHG